MFAGPISTPLDCVVEEREIKPFFTLNCSLLTPSSNTACGSVLPSFPCGYIIMLAII
jgi:hypothetical protein